MLFAEPSRSSWDVNFSLFGVPVRIHPFFWLAAVVLGWSTLNDGVQFLLLWVVLFFVSILIHEMGHVFMGRIFGVGSYIVLHGFGGLAIGANALARPWKRILVSLAGPGAEFVLTGLVFLGYLWLPAEKQDIPLVQRGMAYLIFMNLFWGILNLLPIWPLDGGQVSVDLLGWIFPRSGVRAGLGISLVVSALLAINSLAGYFGRPLVPYVPVGGIMFTLFFVHLAVGSYQALQREQERTRWVDEHDMTPWERRERRWEREDDADYWPQDRGRWEK